MQSAKLKGQKRMERHPRSRLLELFILPFTLLLASCATAPPIPDAPVQTVTAERLTALLKEREAALQTMKGLFRASVKGPGIPFSPPVEGAVYYQRTGAMRLRGFTPFGGELFDFYLGQERFRLKVPSDKKEYAGRLSDLEHRPGIGSQIWLSVWAVNSAIGNNGLGKDSTSELIEDGERYRLEVVSPQTSAGATASSGKRRLWFDRRTLQVVQEDRLDAAGAVKATMTFEDFRPVGKEGAPPAVTASGESLVRPHKIIMKGEPGTLTLKFSEIVPNPELKPEDLGGAGAG
jgi:hypothetical protein